jgi:drug/metabolite transporter (DMT)-like permease
MLGEILSIAAALMWAASTVFSAKALEETDPFTTNALKALFSSILMFFITLALGVDRGFSYPSIQGLFFVIMAAIIGYGIGDTCLFKSITLIGVSRAYTIAYTSPLFVLLLSAIFLGEPIYPNYLIGTVIIIAGIVLASTGKGDGGLRNSTGLLASFAAALLWAIGTIFVAMGLREVDVISANTFRYPFLFLFLFSFSQPWKKKLNLNRRNVALMAVSGALGMVIGGLAFLLSVQMSGAAKATSLSSSSPVWASLMSVLFLKEKLSWKLILSSVVVVVGIYFLT